MALNLFRSSASSLVLRRTKTCCCARLSTSGLSSNAGSDSIISENTVASASSSAASEANSSGSSSRGFSFLKYAVAGSITGVVAFASYSSYAYTIDEMEQKAKELRESTHMTTPADGSTAEKYKNLLYSTAVAVPTKAIELYLDLRRLIEGHVKDFTEPLSDKLLPDLAPQEQHVFTLVLDLNETIIYSDWKRERGWRTFKRPGVDDFLQHLAKFYEIVVYSDQLNMYVEPVLDRLDPNHYIRYRLSRGATKYQEGKHYRDLSKLNRDPAKIIYVSANAFDSTLQPENSVPIKPFKIEDKTEQALDTALLDLIPFLEYVARNSPPDIRNVLASYKREDIAKEFVERSKEHRRRMQEQRQQRSLWRR